MKTIFQNLTESVSADASEPGFPVGNLLNEHSKKRWKSGASNGVVTAKLQGGSNAIALYNIYADSINITISGTTYNFGLLKNDGWGEYRLNSVFLYYGSISSTHTAIIELNISSSYNVACGILFSGVAYNWTNPKFGVETSNQNHSVVYDLDNGFEYVYQRNVSETPSFSMQIADKAEYFNFMRWAKEIYPNPFILRVENFSDELTYYGRLDSLPKGTLSRFNNYQISFSLKEFL